MKPVAIFRHSQGEGPGYFATFLDAHSVPWRLIKIDADEAVPNDATEFAGLCFMGGPMSVNDDLPWLPSIFTFIGDAVARNIPVIGHCLGGQLMSKALGGTVTRNPVKELGWGTVEPAADSQGWLDGIAPFAAFHWHGETFSIPPNAARILGSRYCPNQAFVMGPHLGMQCHVEMTEAMIRLWNRAWSEEKAAPGPSVQTPEQMMEDIDARLIAMRAVADRLYTKWIAALRA